VGVSFDTITAEPVVTFGWRELSDSTRALQDHERSYAGGVLGQVAGISEGPNGDVYVLDRAWQKVVVFDSTGSYRDLVLGGHGAGPGEFGVVRDMAMTRTGTFGVLDEANARVSVFSPSGLLVSTVPLSGKLPLSLALDDSSAWVLHWPNRPNTYAVKRYDVRTGGLTDSLAWISGDVADYAMHGESGAIAVTDGGVLIWALPMNGRLRRIAPGIDTTFGPLIFPDVDPGQITLQGTSARFVAAGARNVVQAHGFIALRHMRMWPDQNGPLGRQEFFLSIIPDDGASARHFSFGDQDDHGLGFALSRDGSAVYIARNEPYPRVEKYILPTVR
jgi:hypothetical protein